eukprot:g1392.t1
MPNRNEQSTGLMGSGLSPQANTNALNAVCTECGQKGHPNKPCPQCERPCRLGCGATVRGESCLGDHLNDVFQLGEHLRGLMEENARLRASLQKQQAKLWKEIKLLKVAASDLSYELGSLLHHGDIEQDTERGAQLVLHAVALDHTQWHEWLPPILPHVHLEHEVEPEPAYRIGLLYSHGEGTRRPNHKKAAEWFRKAASQGHPKAQYRLGSCYFKGEGVVRSNKLACSWWLKAALQGHPWAQLELGDCYEHGTGVIQSTTAALQWYRKSAAQGDVHAREHLEALLAKEAKKQQPEPAASAVQDSLGLADQLPAVSSLPAGLGSARPVHQPPKKLEMLIAAKKLEMLTGCSDGLGIDQLPASPAFSVVTLHERSRNNSLSTTLDAARSTTDLSSAFSSVSDMDALGSPSRLDPFFSREASRESSSGSETSPGGLKVSPRELDHLAVPSPSNASRESSTGSDSSFGPVPQPIKGRLQLLGT